MKDIKTHKLSRKRLPKVIIVRTSEKEIRLVRVSKKEIEANRPSAYQYRF